MNGHPRKSPLFPYPPLFRSINCEARARLAADIIKKRAARDPMLGNQTIQYDLIGVNSVWSGETAHDVRDVRLRVAARVPDQDRKSTRLNSSHLVISYAVFCL